MVLNGASRPPAVGRLPEHYETIWHPRSPGIKCQRSTTTTPHRPRKSETSTRFPGPPTLEERGDPHAQPARSVSCHPTQPSLFLARPNLYHNSLHSGQLFTVTCFALNATSCGEPSPLSAYVLGFSSLAVTSLLGSKPPFLELW